MLFYHLSSTKLHIIGFVDLIAITMATSLTFCLNWITSHWWKDSTCIGPCSTLLAKESNTWAAGTWADRCDGVSPRYTRTGARSRRLTARTQSPPGPRGDAVTSQSRRQLIGRQLTRVPCHFTRVEGERGDSLGDSVILTINTFANKVFIGRERERERERGGFPWSILWFWVFDI